MHIPFLRRFSKSSLAGQDSPPNRPPRGWADLSFLDLWNTDSGEVCGIHEAQVSVVIHGFTDTRWSAVMFVDGDHPNTGGFESFKDKQDSNSNSNSNSDNEDGRGFLDSSFDVDTFQGDPLTNFRCNANEPIEDPRAYFLQILKHQLRIILKEWESLISFVETKMSMFQYPPVRLKRNKYATDSKMNTRKALQWTVDGVLLLVGLDQTLSDTIHEWDKFFRDDVGDINYFSDLPDDDRLAFPRRTILEIKRTFQSLERMRKKIDSLMATCVNRKQVVRLFQTQNTNNY
jgi:hypothetical protein